MGKGVGNISKATDSLQECSICFEDLKFEKKSGKKDLFLTTCNHIFHKQCVEIWQSDKNPCPPCPLCNTDCGNRNLLKDRYFKQVIANQTGLRGKEVVEKIRNHLSELKTEEGIKKVISSLNPENRVAAAKIAACVDGEATSKHIKLFQVDDQKALLRIARRAARQNPEATASHFREYGLKDEKARANVLRLIARRIGDKYAEYRHNFDITTENNKRRFVNAAISGM